MYRAVRLTKQLLTFAKGGDPVKEDVSLGTLVQEVALFDLSGSPVKLVYQQTAELWLAEVDKGQIQQVISNLTINARQAMPEGGSLHITLANTDLSATTVPGLRPGKYVQITVRDEGTGIDPKYLDRIFDPYFTTKQTGSGLAWPPPIRSSTSTAARSGSSRSLARAPPLRSTCRRPGCHCRPRPRARAWPARPWTAPPKSW